MKSTIFILFATLTLFSCANSTDPTDNTSGEINTDGYLDISVAQAKIMLDDPTVGIVVLDVSPVWADGHLPGSYNFPLGSGGLVEVLPMLDATKPYLVYCHFDNSSRISAKMLVDAGYYPVYRLIGNYEAWVQAGYPVE